jgi:hypothetical protein
MRRGRLGGGLLDNEIPVEGELLAVQDIAATAEVEAIFKVIVLVCRPGLW